MHSRRILVWICLVLSLTVIAQAKTNYCYVANNASSTVSVINTANGAVVTSIPVGTEPTGVAVNQAGTSAYVTNYGSANVSVISTSTNKVVATITVGTGPTGVVFSPSGKTAYVANQTSNSVSVINTATKEVTATVTGLNAPVALAVMPNDTFVYVANKGSGTVSVISTLTNTVVATITAVGKPQGLGLSPDGSTLYVPDSAGYTVAVIQTATNTIINTINVSPGPLGAAVSPDGQWLYVTNPDSDADIVTIISTATQTVQTTVVVGTRPQFVTFTEDSTTAGVTNLNSNNISVIDTATMTVKDTIAVGTAPVGIGVMGLVQVKTVAGGSIGSGNSATAAALSFPYSTVQDKKGNYYVTDRELNLIRKITPAGTISIFAGTGICGYNGDSIKSTKAMLCYPSGLAIDSGGNIYVGDSYNQRVRKINAKGTITTVAGNGSSGYGGDGGPATSAAVGNPWDIAFDAGGNMYFSDTTNNVVRKVNTSGTISTYAGTGVAGFSGDGGPAIDATMNQPIGLAFDTSGNLYIADGSNLRIRIVTAGGTINTFAGNGQSACSGDGGPATAASLGGPTGTTINSGALYITDGGCSRVRVVDLTSNIINTFAGSHGGYDGDNNPPLSSRLRAPRNTMFDAAGNTLIDDAGNGRLRKLSGGLINTLAGGYLGDGNSATAAALVAPQALAIDKSGNLYIADGSGNRVRKVSGGKMSTLAGSSVNGYAGDGGPATSALLNYPQGVAVDSNGNVFIADTSNDVIRKVDTTGNISTFATNANFCYLVQMAIDSANNLYVADYCTSVIFKITPGGVVSVFAGVPFNYGYNGDNIPATTAWLNSPFGVAVDIHGNVLIADTYNSRVREVNTSGTISTIAGDGTCNYTGDGGSATSAELCTPYSVGVSSSGTIYVLDISYSRVRQISGGIISAFAGSEAYGFNGVGLWPLLSGFSYPVAVAVDSKGAVYVVDNYEKRVQQIP